MFTCALLRVYARAMLRENRLRLLQTSLEDDGRVIAADVAQSLGVPVDMIRRDLRDLARDGLCKRVYGGAVRRPAVGSPSVGGGALATIANHAAALIEDGQLAFVDSGRTGEAIADAVRPGANITVATTSPRVALRLLARGGIGVVLIGGRIDPSTETVGGATAIEALGQLNFDICMLGACAASSRGITALSIDDAAVKRAAIAASASVVVTLTADKIGTQAPFRVAGLEDADHLIVQAGGPAVELMRMRDAGVTLTEVPTDA